MFPPKVTDAASATTIGYAGPAVNQLQATGDAVAVGVGVPGVTVGVGVGVPGLTLGLGVGVPQPAPVVMFRVHPPLMLPTSPAASSKTQRFQVPLALVPLKAESAEAPPAGGAGAGAGQVSGSGATPTRLVGLNVPVTNVAPVMLAAAASSSVSVTPVMSPPPPQSDMMMAL